MRVGDVVTKIIGLGLVLCALGIMLAVRTATIQIPDRFNPWANLSLDPQATHSRHATAEAFDLAGFVLADGQRIRVVSDWASNGVEGQFLRELRTGACTFFDGSLESRL
jgi:hypothetical protein